MRSRRRVSSVRSFTLVGVAVLTLGFPAVGPVIGYEISVAEIEAGRIRHLAQRLAKQNLLFQLHLGGVRKEDLVDTAGRIDRVIDALQHGSPGYAVPAPWSAPLREQVEKVGAAWRSMRSVAVASPYDYLRTARQFAGADKGLKDPLMLRYFDGLAADLVKETEVLMGLYDQECRASEASDELCDAATLSGHAAMLSEIAVRQAVYIVAGIDGAQNRKRLASTIEVYASTRADTNASQAITGAMGEDRGESGRLAAQLLAGLRGDWDEMRKEFQILDAGDAKNFDLERLLRLQDSMVGRIERFTAAVVRYANIAYGT
ncbi:MAG: type IV pili methyl-accepting chemotaxis transducer N-terminal domain-containing protein [Myxococcota bacterium]